MDNLAKLPLDFSILTERLLLRRVRESDVGEFSKAIKSSLTEIKKWEPWGYESHEYEDTFRRVTERNLLFQLGQDFRFGGFDKNTGKFISQVTLRYKNNSPSFELGYWTVTQHAGKGYATEVTKAMLDCGFNELKMKRIFIRCNVNNGASNVIPTKLRFEFEGVRKNDQAMYDGTLEDMNCYVHTPESWKKFKKDAS